jgi:predicted oxidoreductase
MEALPMSGESHFEETTNVPERRPVEDMLNDVLYRAAMDSPPDSERRPEDGWYRGRDAAVEFIEGELRSWLRDWELVQRG